jgi:pimeloyl-ACP methyl ester carboxylesterase
MAHAPDARLVTFPGSGHGIHIEPPVEFLQAFDEFTASLPGMVQNPTVIG